MDQTIRNKLRGVVTQCRKLLEDSTSQALQGRFGIYAGRKKGEVQIEDEARMSHLTEEDRACRQDLLDHLDHIRAIGYKPSESLEQLVREISFTHLNRLCAYKMMESRGLIREAVSRGLKSQGFFFYLADHPEDEKLHNGGGQETAYRNFFDWLGGTLSQEIGVLFNPNDPANRIYPPQRLLDEVLVLINDGDLKDIWSQDETIGWVYQYFTPKELRDKARKESPAPRNSYELAFRNQFFTPRYVVEFLTDNTLGRIWYEMRKGKTILKDCCKYLVRRPTEIFLKDGEQPPAESKETREDLSQEELLKQPVYIPHRPRKDPREIKVLDPACGSGHFLLYCFDLLQTIYEEAYDDPDLSAALRKDYPAIEDLRRVVPGLILKHNLHGIDIDLRATQIAALALWLRCQRAYQDLGLKNGRRPKITRANIVCAEPMPGEEDIRQEFIQGLDDKLGQLVSRIFDRMKMAGEAGSLLKIEEDIGVAIRKTYGQYGEIFRESDEQRWLKAETDLLLALENYLENAANGRGFRRRLFAEDAEQGFSFIDVCRKRYDVVLMNPPFGDPPTSFDVKALYPEFSGNLIEVFVERARYFTTHRGLVGSVIDATVLIKSSYEKFRRSMVETKNELRACAWLGWGVLDTANVEVGLIILSTGHHNSLFDSLNAKDSPADRLATYADGWQSMIEAGILVAATPTMLESIPNYSFPLSADVVVHIGAKKLDSVLAAAKQGVAPVDSFRVLRLRCEVSPQYTGSGSRWWNVNRGGAYCPFYRDYTDVICWEENGKELKEEILRRYPYLKGNVAWVAKNEEYYGKPGLGYGKRTDFLSCQILPKETVITVEGFGVFPHHEPWLALGFLNSRFVAHMLNTFCGQHKYSGYVDNIPVPDLVTSEEIRIRSLAKSGFAVVRSQETKDVLSPLFIVPRLLAPSISEVMDKWKSESEQCKRRVEEILDQIDQIIAGHWISIQPSILKRYEPEKDKFHVDLIIELFMGCTFGRWDIRFATGERHPPEFPDPFDPLPVCPPGMLQGPDGLPAKPEDVPSVYPIRIDWDGILVDDPGHEDDIIRRVQDVLEVIWKDRAEAVEREACEILGVRDLRDYFRKPGNGGFWMDHVKRYSKSRRKAPIYWYLRSAKGNYGLWLYYHRLDKDILFKALLNYVEPKIRLEGDRLKSLRGRKEAAGSSGREAKQIEKDMDRQEQFVSELHDFADKLRRAANLHLVPDLNDGVVLTIAPLLELMPWKSAKEYWEDLVAGKYEWSSIGKQMREKGLVKK